MSALKRSGGIFDYDQRSERLTEVERELEQPTVWDDPDRAQALGKERADLGSTGTPDLRSFLKNSFKKSWRHSLRNSIRQAYRREKVAR